MKYYAVTEDPNELLHYGVKGMKWGQHIFGDKPKSAGYHRALGKLRGFAKKANSGIKKANTAIKKSAVQASINRQKKQEDKYTKAVEKAQRRINIVENMNNVNRMMDYEKRINQNYKEEHKAEKAALKQERKFAKNEKHMSKYTQLAREGRLPYGKLSDDQVRQITDRLALERSARSLGNTEKPKFRIRMKDALQEGILQGVTQGTAAGMKEVAVAKVQGRLASKRALDKINRHEAERQREASRIKAKKSHKEIREDLKNEAYEAQVKAGVGMWKRNGWVATAGAAKALQDAQAKLSEQKHIQDVQSRLAGEREEKWQNYLDESGLSNKAARKKLGVNTEEDKANTIRKIEDFNKQAEQVKNEAAYKAISDQANKEASRKAEIEAQEKENARLKENYEAELDRFNKDKEHDAALKKQYDADMSKYNSEMEVYKTKLDEYNKAYKLYSARKSYDTTAKEPTHPGPAPIKPSKPPYKNTPQPMKPNYHKIDYSMPVALIPSYDAYLRLRNMGINTIGGGGGNNNNGGNGRKKPKK